MLFNVSFLIGGNILVCGISENTQLLSSLTTQFNPKSLMMNIQIEATNIKAKPLHRCEQTQNWAV